MFPILSVNIGKPTPFEHTAPKVTGIYKQPQTSPVQIETRGLVGDHICDVVAHGSLDQAVYLYGQPDYDFWSAKLSRPLFPGTFGENLLLAGLESASINVGDRFALGSLVLEATAPRIPCRTFAARMEDKDFAYTFLKEGRPGVYCRVIASGPVKTGETLAFIPYSGEKLSMSEYSANWRRKSFAPEELRRYLSTPLHERSRADWDRLQ